MSQIHKFTFPNGARLLIEPNDHVRSAAIGLWCRTGSSHETDAEGGITHFIEHMLFKGTTSRTSREIAEAIEGRGGMLNAFTDKEQTCYYCRVLDTDVLNGVDVLTDMLLHSLLDPEEIARECGVIIEEIKRSEDEPSDFVHDIHIQNRWGDHPFGRPIIGTRDSVSSFRQENFRAYMDRRYRGDNIALAIAGSVDVDSIVKQVEPILSKFPAGGAVPDCHAPAPAVQRAEVGKDVEQVHFCIGTDSVSVRHDDLHGMIVLDAVLGGGMSSRLFQEVREKRGLVYAIGSYNLSYTAGGLYTIYGGTGRQTWQQVQDVVRTELDRMVNEPVPESELSRVKMNIKGNAVLALEGMSSRMMRMAKNELTHGREVPLEETLAKIDAVTHEQLQRLSAEIFAPERISVTAIGPF